jgi:hypothetical protein
MLYATLGLPPLGPDSRCYFGEVIEINEEVEPDAHMLSFGEMGPLFLVNVAGSKGILKIADLDVLQDGFCRRKLTFRRRTVDAPCMTFEVGDKGQSAEERLLCNRTITLICDLIDQRQSGNELSVFSDVPLKSGRQFSRSNATFKFGTKFLKLGKRGLVKVKSRNLVELPL